MSYACIVVNRPRLSRCVACHWFSPRINEYQIRSPPTRRDVDIIISDNGNRHNLNIHISQGSVATRLRCGGMYGKGFVTFVKKVQ